jgi:hypothetical protein
MFGEGKVTGVKTTRVKNQQKRIKSWKGIAKTYKHEHQRIS